MIAIVNVTPNADGTLTVDNTVATADDFYGATVALMALLTNKQLQQLKTAGIVRIQRTRTMTQEQLKRSQK